MVQTNLNDTGTIGTATMQNGDFLTYDALPDNRFKLIIPKLPNVEFFLQSFKLPDIVVNNVVVNTRIVDYNQVGEKLNFSPFTVSFLVDKYCRNWANAFNWQKEMTVQGSNVGVSSDIVLMVDGKEVIRFYGAWPSSLSGFEFETTGASLTYVKADIEFNYDYFDYLGDFATTDSTYK